jgi:hypothetical protein
MPEVKLIYFGDCPNIQKARATIRAAGATNFIEVNQDDLGEGDPRKRYSSPTILLNDEIIVGSANDGACCSIISWDKVSALLRSGLHKS